MDDSRCVLSVMRETKSGYEVCVILHRGPRASCTEFYLKAKTIEEYLPEDVDPHPPYHLIIGRLKLDT